ncbi:orotidine 5'-phosphate decarboxylase [Candidatus Kaiserbacteria bacterium RIFCSPLOWO2_01_FULL_55_19]|uniref:Orotidine 5'-phosphate decarboxylase n=1 Tax=Candidatus Kaiserbacteria bacterium RIFCSPLOWO2_01_FULL_55_19 TaxID=1798516 RepID=A0A1F6ERF7_9BACT|nr:MAG: orotidine 5'-phosphate decarboxylase [Candidatus Kaiserbacteria bacterium RIFCSPLOWO2_01_FULL_55_19]
MTPKDRIIVALDVPTMEQAQALAEELGSHVGGFKIGLELSTAMLALIIGPPSEEEAIANFKKIRRFFSTIDHGQVFWDGKMNDIPNTIAGAARAVAGLNFKMFNLHASAGIEGMMAAVANKGKSLVLAVTILTSFEENNANLVFGGPTKAKVLQFARDAKSAECDGIVCSPQELILLSKQRELNGLLKVTPGIRSKNSPPDDQKRTMAAGEAIMAGADYLVIGRPITSASHRVVAANEFAAEIAGALKLRTAA